MRPSLLRRPVALAIACLAFACQSSAQPADPLRAAVAKAVLSNPEVTARFSAYLAAGDAVGVARSALLPRVDLSANGGRDNERITSRTPESQSTTRSGFGFSVSQLLWDGLGSQREVERVGHEKLSRYFEFLDTTEQTALEAARAYFDVLRYRRLVTLAEDNYVEHRYAAQRIQARFSAGVGRGVDLEQVNARLALAESNLTTEVANLHDVSARYLRIVGETPPGGLLPITVLDAALPASADAVLATAVRQSTAISASVEGLRAARSAAENRQAAYQPRVEARARTGGGNNYDGISDQKRASTVEIVLAWNLFNGGADRARVRQQANLVNQAADLRDKTCRDTLQTAAIAFNDIRKLTEQMAQLDRNTLSIEKARDAYLQQFDIGQRSLLDLLNAENEVYTARRAYAIAEHDRALAYTRTQAGLGQLTATLGIARVDTAATDVAIDRPPTWSAGEASGWSAGNDAPVRCPLQSVAVAAADFNALARRLPAVAPVTPVPALPAMPGLAPLAAPAPMTPRAASAPAAPFAGPAPAASAASAALPQPGRATPAGLPNGRPLVMPGPLPAAAEPTRRLSDWAAAWSAGDATRYLAFYAPTFAPAQGSADAWREKRRAAVTKPGPLEVRLSDVQVTTIDADHVETRFVQTYRSPGFSDTGSKLLAWVRVNGEWLIAKESGR